MSLMQIHELAAALDRRLVQLDQQLSSLSQRQAQAGPQEAAELARELVTLQQLRAKLVKSHELALRAYHLERDTNTQVREQRRQRQQWLGLSLCVVSGLGIVILSYWLFQSLWQG